METDKKGIAKQEGQAIESAAAPEDLLAIANARFEMLDKVIVLALKTTNNEDWSNQDGRPWLNATGAEKVARRFGIGWKDTKETKTCGKDENNVDYYLYTFSATFFLPTISDSIEAIGTCSSNDPFFSLAYGQKKPISKIEEGNIKKKAYSNMLVNGITRLLGIRNFTWEALRKAGLDPDKIAKIDRKGKGKGSEKPAYNTPTGLPETQHTPNGKAEKGSQAGAKPETEKREVKDASPAQLKLIQEQILKSHLLAPFENYLIQLEISKGGMKIDRAGDLIDWWIGEKKQERKKRHDLEAADRKNKTEALRQYLGKLETAMAKKYPDEYKSFIKQIEKRGL